MLIPGKCNKVPATLAFARTIRDLAVYANNRNPSEAIQIMHCYVVHGDGSECLDGCDAAPIPAYQKALNRAYGV